MVTWTIDVDGGDWGGRTIGSVGIRKGLPIILQQFNQHSIKAIFFISTELIKNYKKELFTIKDAGHVIGSHGHFHQVYKRKDRALQDAELSILILNQVFGPAKYPYRAPKFSYIVDNYYSNPVNHVSLLKSMWFGQKVTEDSIFYLHPFDIVEGINPPNLFCRVWYSNPERALNLFQTWCQDYSGRSV